MHADGHYTSSIPGFMTLTLQIIQSLKHDPHKIRWPKAAVVDDITVRAKLKPTAVQKIVKKLLVTAKPTQLIWTCACHGPNHGRQSDTGIVTNII